MGPGQLSSWVAVMSMDWFFFIALQLRGSSGGKVTQRKSRLVPLSLRAVLLCFVPLTDLEDFVYGLVTTTTKRFPSAQPSAQPSMERMCAPAMGGCGHSETLLKDLA